MLSRFSHPASFLRRTCLDSPRIFSTVSPVSLLISWLWLPLCERDISFQTHWTSTPAYGTWPILFLMCVDMNMPHYGTCFSLSFFFFASCTHSPYVIVFICCCYCFVFTRSLIHPLTSTFTSMHLYGEGKTGRNWIYNDQLSDHLFYFISFFLSLMNTQRVFFYF